jgi:hypothetical protein
MREALDMVTCALSSGVFQRHTEAACAGYRAAVARYAEDLIVDAMLHGQPDSPWWDYIEKDVAHFEYRGKVILCAAFEDELPDPRPEEEVLAFEQGYYVGVLVSIYRALHTDDAREIAQLHFDANPKDFYAWAILNFDDIEDFAYRCDDMVRVADTILQWFFDDGGEDFRNEWPGEHKTVAELVWAWKTIAQK